MTDDLIPKTLVFANDILRANKLAREMGCAPSEWRWVTAFTDVVGTVTEGTRALVSNDIRDDSVFWKVQAELNSRGARIVWM